MIKPKVINLSKYKLNEAEIKIMSRGPKFCPTPNTPDLFDVKIAVKDLVRKLELKKHFGDKTSDINEDVIKVKSNYIPPQSSDIVFNSKMKEMKRLTEYLTPVKPDHYNISEAERKAISTLKSNKSIVIKTADKGSAFIIMDTEFYLAKVEERLNIANIYKSHSKNPDNTAVSRLKNFIEKHKSSLTKIEKLCLKNPNFKTSNFVAYPKIHKSEAISKQVSNSNSVYLEMATPDDLKFRYIHAGPNAPTSKLSELLDNLLKPYLTKIPSYIKDSNDFLNKLPTFSENEINDIVFATCDIVDMYSNIELDIVIKSVQYWVSKFPTLLHPRFDLEFIEEGLGIVLNNAFFQFNDKYYSLQCGTGTGTQVAPTIANLAMGYLEITLYSKVKNTFGNNVEIYVKNNWKRFIDDGQICWKKSFGDFNKFVSILNQLHPKIQFTSEVNENKISFLNILLYKNVNQIHTDIFYKDTDTHDYLPFSSCHPRHTKINVPSTLARMVCQIVTDPIIREKRLKELKSWLLKSGYKPDLITNCFKKFEDVHFETLRQKINVENEQEKIVFIQTHNPNNPHIFGKILEIYKSLKNYEGPEGIFKNTVLIKAEKQPPNLGRLLLKSFYSSKPEIPPGVTKCDYKKCDACKFIPVTKSIDFKGHTDSFNIKQNFNCNSKNVIYKISCKGCNEFYIGETVNLKQRISGHKHKLLLEDKRDLQKVYNHISFCAKNYPIPFNITPFYQVKEDSLTARLTIEDHFIKKYNPRLNTYFHEKYNFIKKYNPRLNTYFHEKYYFGNQKKKRKIDETEQ